MSVSRLSAILESILIDMLGLPAAATQVRLLRSWGDIAGPLLAGKTAPGKIRNGVLTVFVPNHAWAQELQLSRPAMLERIRSVAGEGRVREIRFTVRAGAGDPPPFDPPARPYPPRGGGKGMEEDPGGDPSPPPEPAGLEGIRDPETREILRSICRRSSRRKRQGGGDTPETGVPTTARNVPDDIQEGPCG